MIKMSADLMGYLATREQQRQANITAALERLSDRERLLIREAAVMGYVQGRFSVAASDGTPIPPDSQVLALVVDGCLAMGDRYPLISGYIAPDEEA